MRQILFVGDVALGTQGACAVDFLPSVDGVVANLEGPLVKQGNPASTAVWNDEAACLASLSSWNVRAVTLANNHIFDLGEDAVAETQASLASARIKSFGLRATAPIARLADSDGATTTQLVGAGWSLIGCYRGQRGADGVVDIGRPDVALSTLTAEVDPNDPWIAYLHWGYELERYPHPAHRAFAKRLIDAGASAVIGTHAHLVQGIERWKGMPIVYGLGNWAFTEHYFFDGAIAFPPEAGVQLAFEWARDGQHLAHWYSKQDDTLLYSGSESLDGPRVREMTPFEGMADDTYSKWFRENRLRSDFLLPIMETTDSVVLRHAKELLVKARQGAARLVKFGVAPRLSGRRS